MRRLFVIGAIIGLFVATTSICFATINLNSSKSNVYRVVSTVPPDVITKVLAQLDTKGQRVNEATVREILRKIGGGQLDTKVKKIVILPPRGTPKLSTILLLENLADEAAALAVSDEGKPGIKSTK